MSRKYELGSGFRNDILDFLDLKEKLGYARDPFERRLKVFDRMCSERFSEANVITQEIMDAFAQRTAEVSQPNSFNGTMSVINTFAKYQRSIGKASVLCSRQMKCVYSPSYFVFTDEELERLFNAADKIRPDSRNSTRHVVLPVMLRLMYCCGLRPNEVRNIRLCDLSFKDRSLVIHKTKTKQDRKILMSKEMAQLLVQYISFISRYMPQMEYLFENPKCGPYSQYWLKENFAHCIKQAGIPDHGNAHPVAYSLRHTFATNTLHRWLSEGIDVDSNIEFLRAYLGHSVLKSTMYYVHTSASAMLRTGLFDFDEEEVDDE